MSNQVLICPNYHLEGILEKNSFSSFLNRGKVVCKRCGSRNTFKEIREYMISKGIADLTLSNIIKYRFHVASSFKKDVNWYLEQYDRHDYSVLDLELRQEQIIDTLKKMVDIFEMVSLIVLLSLWH